MATTFDLTYTGGNVLNVTSATIKGNSSIATVLWTVAYNYEFPQSVLNNYDPNNPGDCSKPLGAACVRTLEQHNLNGSPLVAGKYRHQSVRATLGSLSKDAEID